MYAVMHIRYIFLNDLRRFSLLFEGMSRDGGTGGLKDGATEGQED